MRRFLWAIALLLPVWGHCAYANSIPTFTAQANMPFLVNVDGENQLTTTFNGPGVSIVAEGGDVVCDSPPEWCTQGVSFSLTPGSSLTPSIDLIDFDGSAKGTVRFGGQFHPVQGLGLLFPSAITAGSFTFPKNGNGTFTISVPATLNGPIVGHTADFSGDFNLQIPPGRLVLTFDFFPGQDGFPASYGFSQGVFTTVPEPGTLGLMMSGLAGIVGAALRKRNCQRSAN
jgi:PEP-CTERM motif-containing protein